MKENYIKQQKPWISTSHKMSNIFKQYPVSLLLITNFGGLTKEAPRQWQETATAEGALCSSVVMVLCSVNCLVARANRLIWRQRRAYHPLWLITNKYCNRNIWTVWYRALQACSADTGFLRDFLALLTSWGYISVLDTVNVGCNVVAYMLQFILFLANTFISNNTRNSF